MLILCVVVSVIVTGLYSVNITSGIMPDMFIGLLCSAAVFIFINVRMLRQCFFELRSRFIYYAANYAAYFIFVAINMAVYEACGNEIYTWLFAITKAASYTRYGFSAIESAVIFHGVMSAVILFSPVGMGRLVLRKRRTKIFYD